MRRISQLPPVLAVAVFLPALVTLLAAPTRSLAQSPLDQSMSVNLSAPDAKSRWIFLDDTATIADGALVLDGRRAMSRAFLKPFAWKDVSLDAQFRVDDQPSGVLACGFVVRAIDTATYYYVHFDRTQAILVRSSLNRSWNEVKRVTGLDKPAGKVHRARLLCVGTRLEVFLNGKRLFATADGWITDAGRIGFYANQGKARVTNIVVRGTKRDAPREFPTPEPLHTVVCADAGAGAYEAFPDACRLADGRLLCVFYAGYGHVALPTKRLPKGGRVSYVTSKDEGRSWSAAKTLYDGPDDDRDPSITQLPDGRLLCNYFSLRRPASGSGFEFVGSFLVESRDAGATWSAPRLISRTHATSAPIRVLSDGRLILGLYYEKDGVAFGAVTISKDGGKSWGSPVKIDNNGAYLDAETDVFERPDGTLYAAMRGGKGAQMHWSVSKDGGATWSTSRPIGFAAHCPYFHLNSQGVLLLAHRIPATSLHYSTDHGKTWSANVVVDDVSGAYPSMVELRDGSTLIVYYEEGGGSNIRAKKFRATRSGVKWLRFK